jgi:S-(hydroxymethyl)glutathione dehydrogenase / alcohol dehydrogenase
MQMQAAVLHAVGDPLQIETVTLDDPQPGEVRVKIVASGVCHSDYHLMTGDTQHPLPAILGHEGAGVVEATGAGVTHVQVGDHVSLNWTPDCGACFYCLHNQPNLCDTYTEPIWAGVMLDGTTRVHLGGDAVYLYCGLGTYAEYVNVAAQSCVKIRPDAPLKVAALIGCAVATGVGATLYTDPVKPGDTVAVYGCGGIGLNILQGAALAGARTIIAVDNNAHKMQMAQQFGATHSVMADDKTAATICDLTNGRGADHVYEAVGLPTVQEAALDAVRPGGTLTLVGLAPMGTGTNLPGALLTRQEKTVKGSYYGSVQAARDFPLLLDLYMEGKLQLDQLISQEYRLGDINTAFDAMLTGDVARGIIVYD